jgi:hypothetical protein
MEEKIEVERIVLIGRSSEPKEPVFKTRDELRAFENTYSVLFKGKGQKDLIIVYYTYEEFVVKQDDFKNKGKDLLIVSTEGIILKNSLFNFTFCCSSWGKGMRIEYGYYSYMGTSFVGLNLSKVFNEEKPKSVVEVEKTVYIAVPGRCSLKDAQTLFLQAGYKVNHFDNTKGKYTSDLLCDSDEFCLILRDDRTVGRGTFCEFYGALSKGKTVYIYYKQILYLYCNGSDFLKPINSGLNWENFALADFSNIETRVAVLKGKFKTEPKVKEEIRSKYNTSSGILAESVSPVMKEAIIKHHYKQFNLLLMSSL